MRSHAAAFAWEFRRRHRWGLIAITCYLLVLAIFRILIVEPGLSVTFDDERSFSLVVVVPMGTTFMYFLAVFTFGLAGDLAARRSMFPPRMFTLPVTSAALAGWPMIYGTAAMALLWLAMRFLAVWPSGFDVPLIWPALFAAVFLAWTQALLWMPYALPGMRVIVTLLWLPVIVVVVSLALYYEVPELVMVAILAPNLPVAYLVARFAVARARRGDEPDWRGSFARLGRIADVLPGYRDHFSSPSSAQVWFEWRQHGRSLPMLVGILLPFELSMLFVFKEAPSIVFETLLAVLLTPPFMAVFVAATVSKPNSSGSDSHGVTPFTAGRPLTSASLIAAKLKVTVWSTLVTWLLVGIAIPLALAASGTLPLAIDWGYHLRDAIGMPRAIAIVLLALAAAMSSTWKQLVQSLCIGMTGREWIVKGSAFLALSILAVIVPVLQWIVTNELLWTLIWTVFPWIIGLLACFKLLSAAWIAIRLHDSGLLSDRTLVVGAACWAFAVTVLYGVLVWFFSFRFHVFVLVAMLSVPLVRISAAPLALAWNRHR